MKTLKNLIESYSISTFFLLVIFIILSIPSDSKPQDVKIFDNLKGHGQITDIAIVPSAPKKMFIGTHFGDGLYMSNNGGNNWQAVETNGKNSGVDDFKNQMVFDISIAPSNSQIIWVAHDIYLEKSTDCGQSWTHISHNDMQLDCNCCKGVDDGSRFCHTIAIDPFDPDTVYVGTSGPDLSNEFGAVYKTMDGGNNWSKIFNGNDFDFAVWDMDIDHQDNKILWIVTSNSVDKGTLYRSNDGGETWDSIFSGTPYGSYYLSVAVKPNDSNIVFAGSGLGVETHLFDGNSWLIPFAFPSWPVDDSLYVEDIAFDPLKPEVLYTTWFNPFWGDHIGKVGRGIYEGDAWTWEIYTHDFDFISLSVHPSDPNIIFAGDRIMGLFKSNNHGKTWNSVSNGISADVIYDIEIDPMDSKHIIIGTISGAGEKWEDEPWYRFRDLEGTARSIMFDPMNSLIIYVGMEGVLVKSHNGGADWSFTDILAGPNDGSRCNYISDIAIDPTDTNTIFITVNEVNFHMGEIQKSTDGGISFTKVLERKNISSENYHFNAVSIDPSDSQHIYAGGGNFLPPKVIGDLWESTDGGNSWHLTSLKDVIVNSILIHPKDPDIIYVGTGYSRGAEIPLYKSIDGGVSWTPSFDGIPGGADAVLNSVTDLAFHSKDLNVVYASTRGQGIFISPNNGVNWLKLGTPEYFVNAIAISSCYGASEGGLLQLIGTGCLYGHIYDANSQANIDANIITEFCVRSKSKDGEFMMISFAGEFSVTAVSDGYANLTQYMTLSGGDAIRLNFPMLNGISGPIPCSEQEIYSKGNEYCFITTVTKGTKIDKQVRISKELIKASSSTGETNEK